MVKKILSADKIVKGDAIKVINEKSGIDETLEGNVRIGGQEHFYLETHVSLNERGSEKLNWVYILGNFF